MSYIDNINQASTANASGSSAELNTNDIMGKEDFLTLLVAQLQNQDPLNPDDPTEFTAQLAQFSSLEQLFNMNESMDNLVQSNANSDKFSTLQTIGKHVVYQDSSFEYSGEGPVHLGYQLDGQASEVQVAIQRNGATIAVLNGTELTQGNHFLTWDGTNQDGVEMGQGTYNITISAKAREGESVAASPLIKSEVTGVDLTGNYGGRLMTRAGEVAFASILGVYDIEDAAVGDESISDSASSMIDETDVYYNSPYLKGNDSSIINSATDEVANTADKNVLKDDGQFSFHFNL